MKKKYNTIGVLCESERPRLALICSILARFSFRRRVFPSPLIIATASPISSDFAPLFSDFIHRKCSVQNKIKGSGMVQLLCCIKINYNMFHGYPRLSYFFPCEFPQPHHKSHTLL